MFLAATVVVVVVARDFQEMWDAPAVRYHLDGVTTAAVALEESRRQFDALKAEAVR